ncbi:hypothetical protein N431DRAFT_418563 [Stipitochalara longipes BDJ]|nr:hypothetical protein N431DRAFT_418563 [Stipitochalara longipes BDJ]
MVDSSPLPPDTNAAPAYLILCGILAVIGAGLCIARITTRLRPSPHLHRDDYMIAVATILSFCEYILGSVAAAHGWGRRSAYVSQRNRTIVFKSLFAVELIWIISIALVRISVACSLLRLGRCTVHSERLWQGCLRTLVGVQCFVSSGWLVFLFFNCRPLRGMWDPVQEEICWPNKYTVVWGYVANSTLILMDFTLALMPIQLIRTLNRPFREKILISCLMALGLLATGIAGYKIPLSQEANSGDLLSTTVKLSVWNKLEEQLGIIAACLPCLKAQIERLLYRFGILKSRLDPLPTFSTSPQDTEKSEVEDIFQNNSTSGSVSFGTNTDETGGTIATFNSKTTSSETKEVGSQNWDVPV